MRSSIPVLIKTAQDRGTPLVTIRTADPASTIKAIEAGLNGAAGPLVQWDSVRGLSKVNEAGQTAIKSIGISDEDSSNPLLVLQSAKRLPPKSLLFWHNIQRFTEEAALMQGVWNLRDEFKKNQRMFVGLCPGISLPGELTQDMLLLDEPLPGEAELADLARKIYASVELPDPDEAVIQKIIDATLGLAAFPAEQAMAMSLRKAGMDLDELWTRKCGLIEQAKGLQVYRGKEKFADIGGYENLKAFFRLVIGSQVKTRGIVFMDEIEKAIGSGMDTSGVSQDFRGQLLSWMTDSDAKGIILIGPPGTSKSMFAKALGNEAGVPTIIFDLGGMKGSLVGASEQAMRYARNVVDAVTQKRAYFVATCNSIGILPPELRRRFTDGIFFVDLPSKTEQQSIWSLYTNKYKLPEQKIPESEGWSGAEIAQCAEKAWRFGTDLVTSAKYIVPVSVSARDKIEQLRRDADGAYISASREGVYRHNREDDAGSPIRKIQLEDGGVSLG